MSEPVRVSHYELGRRLGRGGMGEVYEAFDVKARRKVALKFVAPEFAADPEIFQRFESEAVNAAQMHHPHIATLFEFEPEGDRPFIAMELVQGTNLRRRIGAGPLALHDALVIARDVASALAYAHRRNIIHRDIKPENLMFDEDGRIKVMDFGLARALFATRLTMTGSAIGTASYMSPEGLAGKAGPAADVFALGLVLHEMLTGRQAFPGDSPLSVMFMIANQEAPRVLELRPDAGEAVDALVQSMLLKDPERRIGAAGAAQELARLTGQPYTPVDASSTAAAATGAVTLPFAVSEEAPTLARPVGVSEEAPTVALPGAVTAAVTLAAPRSSAATMPLAATTSPPAASSAAPSPVAPPRASRRGVGALVLALGGVAVIAALGLIAYPMLRSRVSPDARKRAVALTNAAYDSLQANNPTAARAWIAAALTADPHNSGAKLDLAMIHHALHQDDSAATAYGEVLDARGSTLDDRYNAHYGLGNLEMDSGAYARAVEHFTACVGIDSARKEGLNSLGFALIENGRAAEGLAVLERGLRLFPSEAALNKNAALASWRLGAADAALRYADRALLAQPGYPAALGIRARARARTGDRAGALSDWHAYLATHPSPEDRNPVASDLLANGIPASEIVGAIH